MKERLRLRIGYLPIIDHLILGISAKRDGSKFRSIHLEPIKFHSWPELADALEKDKIDGGFIMAPYAISLKSSGSSLKTVLLGHREGLGLVVSNKIHSLKDIKGGVIGIPDDLSTHSLLLHKYLSDNGINYFKDIKTVELAPPDFVKNLTQGKIIGYFGSEPFGAQAEYEHVGKVQILSKDIKKHHIDCILVLKENLLKNTAAIQELVDSLVNSGTFMYEKPTEASKIGSEFLSQPPSVLYEVLNEKKRRVSSWDLLPLEKEFDEIQNYMVDKMNLLKKKIDISKFVDSSFAKKSYEKITVNQGIRQRRKILREKIIYPLMVFISILLIWQFASWKLISSSLFPSPIEVLRGTVEIARSGVLFVNIFTSLYRVFVGFILAVIFGIPIGLLLGTYKKSRFAFEPLIQIIKPISPIAWIPLAIFWFGIGNKPAIFIIFITAFFPIMLASQSAVKNIDVNLIKAARNFGTKGKNMITKIILPASFPYIMVGIRISLGISWVIIVAAEMVGMHSGLGYMILDARNFLRTDLIISGMIIIGLIGFALDRILGYFEDKVKAKWSYKEIL